MDNACTISLPKFSNLHNFESLLKTHYKRSKGFDKIIFDFSNIEWIGSLQISILYGWIYDLINKRKRAIIEVPPAESTSQAVNFLTRINFFEELKKIGTSIPITPPLRTSCGLAAFKNFPDKSALLSYETALGMPNSYEYLLNGGGDVDIIRDGDLREMLLHEPGENAFIQGNGRNVRYAVGEFPQSNDRKEHPFFSTFKGKSCIEVVVSDTGTGLLKKLKSSLPDDYFPETALKNKILSKSAKIIVYAFEFSSTSNEEGREARIAQIIQEDKDITQAIPTGLFYVSTLAKLYGGQILVRTSNILINLDFSTPSQMAINYESRYASIPGTHILVRVPRHRQLVSAVQRKIPISSYVNQMKFISIALGDIKCGVKSDANFITEVEKFLSMVLNLAEIIIACFVDGRNEEVQYYTVKREDRPHKVVALAIQRHKILLYMI